MPTTGKFSWGILPCKFSDQPQDPRMVKILELPENRKAAMMEFRMKNGKQWARLLAYATGPVNQELLLQN